MQYPAKKSIPLPLSMMSSSCLCWFTESVGEVRCITPIFGGHHKNWLCETSLGRFVLRQPSSVALSGVDYQRETEILQAVRPFTWAIKAKLFTSEEPWLISHYVEGHQGDDKIFQTSNQWQQLMLMFEQRHELTQPLPTKTHYRDIANYLQHALRAASVSHKGAQFSHVASQWLSKVELEGSLSLNHHDLTPANVRVTPEEQMVILDWEYAAVSLYGWDAARLSEHFQLTVSQKRSLATCFNLSLHQLQIWGETSKLLNLLWYWSFDPSKQPKRLEQSSAQWLKKATQSY